MLAWWSLTPGQSKTFYSCKILPISASGPSNDASGSGICSKRDSETSKDKSFESSSWIDSMGGGGTSWDKAPRMAKKSPVRLRT